MSILLNASTSTGLGITSDNSGSVEIQSNGTTKLTVQTSGVSGTITHATAQASTSGTAIDFTGIPSWAKKITVIFNGVSTNGSSNTMIQIGAGSVDTSGYASISASIQGTGSTVGGTVISTGFVSDRSGNSTSTRSGNVILTTLGSNIWVASGVIASPIVGWADVSMVGGNKTLAGTLDRIRITTVNGTDTFDAGSINIMYEG
jgi:hypothetical protein